MKCSCLGGSHSTRVNLTKLSKVGTPLVGIGSSPIKVEGSNELSITLGDVNMKKTLRQPFMVAKISAPDNAMFDRPLLNELGAMLS